MKVTVCLYDDGNDSIKRKNSAGERGENSRSDFHKKVRD